MRKVFSTLFVLCLFMPTMASAATNPLYTTTPNGRCYGTKGETYNANAVDTTKTNLVEKCDYRIFFYNDKREIAPTPDDKCKDELMEKLKKAHNTLSENGMLYFIGIADMNGADRYNSELAYNRAQNVMKELQNKLGMDETPNSWAAFYAGETDHKARYYGSPNHDQTGPEERAVCVIIGERGHLPEGFNINVTQRTATEVKIGVDFSQGNGQDTALANINSTVSKIKSLSDAIGRSVWKDKEGGFNTSRLVSDSVAGVVLGTAGGLIVSHVVKKNQVKHGLEGMHCTVGGQVVADHGDDFIVGIN